MCIRDSPERAAPLLRPRPVLAGAQLDWRLEHSGLRRGYQQRARGRAREQQLQLGQARHRR
eukprot:7120830-Alexandrium_andersonii.AAC.1